jgi:hypothetical protein
MSDTPKLFVSYSWTPPDHEARVLQLAKELVEAGVDVIIDKWHLREGHDAHAFMEQMVTNPDITKVILVCDKAYAEKANRRKGGVGTEAQIMSAEIYAKRDQSKFVAVVTERDDDGNAYVPAYYKSRIYIDYSDRAKIAENFEQLLRWVYDKPLHERPPLGKKPTFLSEDKGGIALATSVLHRRAIEAVKNNRDHAMPAVIEYFTLFASEMEKLRLDPKADPFDEAVVQSIEAFTPYRNESVELFITLAMYRDTLESRTALHRFFEQLIPYLDHPPGMSSWKEWAFDNFKFIIHELFLYAIACLIRHERFESAAYVMANDYYVPGRSEYGRDAMTQFDVLRRHLKSLEYRNQRLKGNRVSIHADLLVQHCVGAGIELRHLMQADFVLYLRHVLHASNSMFSWWPVTLSYADRHSGPFEVFARSKSAAYFSRAKVMLGIEGKQQLQALLEKHAANPSLVPQFGYEHLNVAGLAGFDQLASKP